jgi:dTDP-glucose 4,6-dehydratase
MAWNRVIHFFRLPTRALPETAPTRGSSKWRASFPMVPRRKMVSASMAIRISCEACAMAYQREQGADTRIARIFNTYGPRMSVNDGRVITTFVCQALSNEPMTVYGDGTQARCFCYVSDMIMGLIKTMEGDFHEPINLGNPEEVGIVELAKEVLQLVPESRSKVVFQPAPVYDPRVRRPDISRAKQILGWAPKVARLEGLGKTVQYYRELRKG